jgi:hypothetical protein
MDDEWAPVRARLAECVGEALVAALRAASSGGAAGPRRARTLSIGTKRSLTLDMCLQRLTDNLGKGE